MSATVSASADSPIQMVPSFLPPGEVIGWSLNSIQNPVTKKTEFTYTVSIQTVGAFRSAVVPTAEGPAQALVACDGPCGNRVPSTHLINMGQCDHLLCKACYGLVKNPDGSYGCSNFYCWADAREDFRSKKDAYRKIISKQICRARKLKRDGEDVKTCTEANLPPTPFKMEKSKKRKAKTLLSASSSSSDVNSLGLIKLKL